MSKNLSVPHVVEIAKAIHRQQSAWAKVVKSPLTYSTTEIHKALVNAKVFSTPIEMKQGWSALAKLALLEYPGARQGPPVVSNWRGAGGTERVVRPKEWVHITDEQLAKWEHDVLNSKRAVEETELTRLRKRVDELGDLANLGDMVKDLQVRVEQLEKLLAEALGTVAH